MRFTIKPHVYKSKINNLAKLKEKQKIQINTNLQYIINYNSTYLYATQTLKVRTPTARWCTHVIYNSTHARAHARARTDRQTDTHAHTHYSPTAEESHTRPIHLIHYREEEMETDTVSRMEQMFMRADLRVESKRRISKGSEFHWVGPVKETEHLWPDHFSTVQWQRGWGVRVTWLGAWFYTWSFLYDRIRGVSRLTTSRLQCLVWLESVIEVLTWSCYRPTRSIVCCTVVHFVWNSSLLSISVCHAISFD